MRILLLSCLLLQITASFGQKMVVRSNRDSTFVVAKESRFDVVSARLRQDHVAHPTMPGYRVQIYFGVNRPKATEVKLDFCSKYVDVPAYLTYQQPNYKVRIGDFRNRYEAFEFLKRIEGQYPTNFVVPDNVKFPSLLSPKDKLKQEIK